MADQFIRIGSPYQSYQTDFSTAEDPLSYGGRWLANTNGILTRFRTSGGRAIAKATGAGDFDDSAALLSGFGNNVELTSTVYKDTGINTGATHECEFLLRATQISSTISVQYECLFSFTGNIQFVRWFNNGGAQGFDFVSASSGPESLGRPFVTGDRIRARCSGSTFTMSCIEADGDVIVLGVYNDSTLASGMCGIGGFVRTLDGANPAHFCFEDFHITEI
ncbi:MAG TPA: hypothetical protein VFN67_02290 [Polyangiales bacterium]|nr:hypothetical protein [Polyangiales bacterium]